KIRHRYSDVVGQSGDAAADLPGAGPAPDGSVQGVIAAQEHARSGRGVQTAAGQTAARDLQRAHTGARSTVIEKRRVYPADVQPHSANAVAHAGFVDRALVEEQR